MKYYSQYHSCELFELQVSLGFEQAPLGEACRQSSLGQDRAGLVDKVRLIQLRCLADLLTFLDFLPGSQAVSSRASAGMIASVSKPFGLLPKDLALIGMVALQSWAIQCKKVQSKLGKAVAYTVMQGKYNYMRYSLI